MKEATVEVIAILGLIHLMMIHVRLALQSANVKLMTQAKTFVTVLMNVILARLQNVMRMLATKMMAVVAVNVYMNAVRMMIVQDVKFVIRLLLNV
jgi:hypothetical protein